MQPSNEHLNILYRWTRFAGKYSLEKILCENNARRIAIYGGGFLGRILYEHLCDTSIRIEYVIDRNRNLSFPYDVRVIPPDEVHLLKTLDAVIVTIDYHNVEEMLRPHIRCLSLHDLIVDIDDIKQLEEVKKYISNNGAKLILADMTAPLYHIKNPTLYEKTVKHGGINYRYYLNNLEALIPYYNDLDNCSIEYIREVYGSYSNASIINKNGIIYLTDINSMYFNVVNHCRLTTDTPDNYHNTIHFFGNCISVGCFAEDKNTVESYLQRKMNNMSLNNRIYRVINHSNWQLYPQTFPQILCSTFIPGDYVVILNSRLENFKPHIKEDNTIKYIRLASAFDRPHEYGEVFFDSYHMGHRGYKLIAEQLYNILATEIIKDTDIPIKEISRPVKANNNETSALLSPETQQDLEEYLDFLNRNKEPDAADKIIGSVVVNCNPFTLGHRFLIENALKECDFLYVFVVEEDKSFFPFNDRIECVKRGLADLGNVKVLPSGKFIISTLTFPEYFIKDQFDAVINVSLDVESFATKIAPALSITKRFVGEEPNCQVTRQYNRVLAESLPTHGVELIVFKRIEVNDGPISASSVRELLASQKYEELKKLVPISTFEFLKERNFYSE